MLLIVWQPNIEPKWKACTLKAVGMLETVLSSPFKDVNATYGRLAQCEAKLVDLLTENDQYD